MLTKRDTKMIVDVLNQALEQFNKVIADHNTRIEALEINTNGAIPGGVCRFCGSTRTHVEDLGGENPFTVCCENCGAVGPCTNSIAAAKQLWAGDTSDK